MLLYITFCWNLFRAWFISIWIFYISMKIFYISLVRAKLYPLERVTGWLKCHGRRCVACLNVNETSTFTSSVTHETYKRNHRFDCNSKCFIYLLTCKQCSEQYVGQTIDDFWFRENNCKENNRKYLCMKHIAGISFWAFFRALVAMDFWMMFWYSSSIRQILQIFLNEKIVGEELSKPWHLLGLILKTVFD